MEMTFAFCTKSQQLQQTVSRFKLLSTVGNALDKVQAIDFIKTQHLSTHVFLIFCDKIKHSAAYQSRRAMGGGGQRITRCIRNV